MEISNIFKEELFRGLIRELGTDTHIVFGTKKGMNGDEEEVVTIHKDGTSYAATFHLKRLYEGYSKNPTVLNSMAAAIMRKFQNVGRMNVYIEDYQEVKDKICVRLMNADSNHDYLAEIPHIPYLDLAVVFYVLLEKHDHGNITIIIKQNILDMWKKTIEDIYADALWNMKEESVRPEPIQGIMEEIIQDKLTSGELDLMDCLMMHMLMTKKADRSGLYVLTNQNNFFGASRMLETDTLQKLSKKLDCSLYLIPASVHEILILPADPPKEPEMIEAMVREVNLGGVNIQERLSNSVYLFDKDTLSTRIIKAGAPL